MLNIKTKTNFLLVFLFAFILVGSLGFTFQAEAAVDYEYYATSTFTSTNLLSGTDAGTVLSFFASTSQPTGTQMKVQFATSSDGPWYGTSTDVASTTLSSGTTTLDLTGLNWSGPDFYYRMRFYSNDAGTSTPELHKIELDYNVSPASPSSPSLSDGASNVSTDATLSVSVSDSESDSMDVSFYNASNDNLISTDSSVSSGNTASVTWSSLSEGTTYSWYAVADDGTDSATSSNFSFTTKSSESSGGTIPPSWLQNPTEPEQGFNVTISQGNTTDNREIDLILRGGPDAIRMALSSTLDFDDNANTGQIDYQNSYQWDLCYRQDTCEKGTHSVYVKFYTFSGQSSKVVSDSITLTEGPEKPTSQMTTEELKAKVQELIATITRLTKKLNRKRAEQDQSGNIPFNFNFTKDLEKGMTEPQVKYLQVALNSDIDTRLAEQGVGSPGNETSYFGSLTKEAVIEFQEKYSQQVLKPWNLKQGTGYVGKTTRKKFNELLPF